MLTAYCSQLTASDHQGQEESNIISMKMHHYEMVIETMVAIVPSLAWLRPYPFLIVMAKERTCV